MQSIVNGPWRSKPVTSCVGRESKDEKDDEQDDSVNVVGKESSLDSTKHGVHDNTEGKKKTGCCRGHSSQGADDGGPASEQHGCYENVCEEPKGNVDEMSRLSIASTDSLEECLIHV